MLPMRVALIPLRTHVKRPDLNWQRFVNVAEEAVARERVDVICLPECAFTGYLYEQDDLAGFAEPIPGPTTDKVASLARQLRAGVCFGLVERAATGIFNRSHPTPNG
ncbi:MAG TPA: carbon-nitrogen hydrolase family protein [Chloroflexi bacterium]|nr:carbon-nitrogen hydrolase family protein [Chloroflexota bacterium]